MIRLNFCHGKIGNKGIAINECCDQLGPEIASLLVIGYPSQNDFLTQIGSRFTHFRKINHTIIVQNNQIRPGQLLYNLLNLVTLGINPLRDIFNEKNSNALGRGSLLANLICYSLGFYIRLINQPVEFYCFSLLEIGPQITL